MNVPYLRSLSEISGGNTKENTAARERYVLESILASPSWGRNNNSIKIKIERIKIRIKRIN